MNGYLCGILHPGLKKLENMITFKKALNNFTIITNILNILVARHHYAYDVIMYGSQREICS